MRQGEQECVKPNERKKREKTTRGGDGGRSESSNSHSITCGRRCNSEMECIQETMKMCKFPLRSEIDNRSEETGIVKSILCAKKKKEDR